MEITSATFLISNTDHSKFPIANKPEYAFVGRSNVGKSSLINLITKKGLAKVSGTPGKTQTINHFLINESWYLVDLPGYGYAKISKTKRKQFQTFISNYLKKRENLISVFLLIDSRHNPLKNDIDFMNYLAKNQIPFVIVFTKIDKLSKYELNKKFNSYSKELYKYWEELPPITSTSSENKIGKDEIIKYIRTNNIIWNQFYESNH